MDHMSHLVDKAIPVNDGSPVVVGCNAESMAETIAEVVEGSVVGWGHSTFAVSEVDGATSKESYRPHAAKDTILTFIRHKGDDSLKGPSPPEANDANLSNVSMPESEDGCSSRDAARSPLGNTNYYVDCNVLPSSSNL